MLPQNPTAQDHVNEVKKDKMIITSLRSTVNVGGGGYAYRGDGGFGSCDYCTPKTICEMAMILKMSVHLSGDWSIVGRKGFGELVSALEFHQLLLQYCEIHPNGKYVKQNYF